MGTSISQGYALRYAFHFNLLNNTGLLLGTASGANFEYAKHGGFEPGPNIIFPSITAGLVQGLSYDTRLAICAEYSASWYRWLKTLGGDKKPAEAPIIPDTATFFIQYDHFYSRTRSVTALAGWSLTQNNCLGDCKADTLVGTMKVKNEALLFQIGVTWQPGDELGQY